MDRRESREGVCMTYEEKMFLMILTVLGLIALLVIINTKPITDYSVEDVKHFDAVRAEKDSNR